MLESPTQLDHALDSLKVIADQRTAATSGLKLEITRLKDQLRGIEHGFVQRQKSAQETATQLFRINALPLAARHPETYPLLSLLARRLPAFKVQVWNFDTEIERRHDYYREDEETEYDILTYAVVLGIAGIDGGEGVRVEDLESGGATVDLGTLFFKEAPEAQLVDAMKGTPHELLLVLEGNTDAFQSKLENEVASLILEANELARQRYVVSA